MRKANEGRWLANPLFGYMERVKKQVWDRNKTSSFPINSYQVGGGWVSVGNETVSLAMRVPQL